MNHPIVEWSAGLNPPRFNLQIVRRYPPQDVRRSQFLVEETLSGFMGGVPSQQTSDPNAPVGGVTRFAMHGPKANLQVADNSVTYNASFAGRPGSGLRQPLAKAAAELGKLDDVFGNQPSYFWSTSLSASFSTADKAAQLTAVRLLSKLLFTDPSDDVIGFTRSEKIQDAEYDVFFNITPFEAITFEGKGPVRIQFDVDFTDMTEFGIELKVEVATRGQKHIPQKGMGIATMNKLIEYLQNTPTVRSPIAYSDYL